MQHGEQTNYNKIRYSVIVLNESSFNAEVNHAGRCCPDFKLNHK